MRIISLTMNAFSTYHQQTTIEFDQLLDHGLYLISGPTGAGKTTIFDAITFALYGTASGSERQQSHFRSDFADAKEETYVELVFELHQKIYTVRRSPTYTRRGYKTAKPANAFLTYDHQTIEGVKEVNQKINQLLGVDVHQFKQIVMIAQGEFTKLIYANSEEREKVLRHIFHTEHIVVLENTLREKTNEWKVEYLGSYLKLQSKFQTLKLPESFMEPRIREFQLSYVDDARVENKKIHQRYLELQKQYQENKILFDKASQMYYQKEKENQDILKYYKISLDYQRCLKKEKDMQELSQVINQLKMIQKQQSMIDQYLYVEKDLKKNQLQYDHVLQEEQNLLLDMKVKEKSFRTLPELQNLKDQYLLQIKDIQNQIDQQKKYQEINNMNIKVQKDYDRLSQNYHKLLQKHQKLLQRMERDQDNVDQLPVLQMQLDEMDRLVQESHQKRLAIHDLSDLYDSLKNAQDSHYELSRVYQERNKNYLSLFQHYQHEDEKFKRQQAGILALELKEGQPCPVCGSLHHPQAAQLSLRVMTSVELDDLLKEMERAGENKDDVYQELLQQNQNIESIRTKINVYKEQLNIEEELSKEVFIHLLSNMLQISKEQERKYQKQLVEIEYLKKVERSLQGDQKTLQNYEIQLEEMLLKMHDLEKMLAGYQVQLNTLEIVLPKDRLQDQLLLKQKELKQIEKTIQEIDEGYHLTLRQVSSKQKEKESLQKRCHELQGQYNGLKNSFDRFVEKHFQQLDDFFDMQEMLETLGEKEKIYQEYQIQKRTLSSQLEQLQQYHGLKPVDLSQEKQNLKHQEKQLDFLYQQMKEQDLIYQQNQSSLKQIQELYQHNQDILQKYRLYQDLYDYTSGKNPQKLSFERYILSAYFDMILEYANFEFLKMSQGRFTLQRKKEIKGAKQQGLDLSVLDYETGVVRDIQSLSGGESFKAALSLALGLSSMIQSYAGGIELNTLFIDEGFGSLDSESLDQALNVLLDLKNDHKIIGIISHVRELKERIHTQIVVDKKSDGSILHIERD